MHNYCGESRYIELIDDFEAISRRLPCMLCFVYPHMAVRASMMYLKGKRVFILESDLLTQSLLETYLFQQGALVFFSAWDNSVLKQIDAALPIDALLVDLSWPGALRSLDLLEQIQNVP